MEADVTPFEYWIKSNFDKVLAGKSDYEEVNGNVCLAEIGPFTTKIYDNLIEDNEEYYASCCEVDTKELRELIDEWCDKVREQKNMQNKINIKLEEYIPLKIVFNKDEEAVEYISYSKDKSSSLEFVVGKKSKLIKRITLLLCKDYSETTNELVVENFEDRKMILNSDNVECTIFKTILYSNGARIILSDKNSFKYIKTDKVYFGLSDTDNITEICICDMSASELEHLKNELELQ